ncbi:hypothetical protein HYS54_04765 [Candidatus Micrarchaeota archaeon]|nr:hypothetical protein [Candidatus Micrarchaeota archaeon]
MILSTTARKPGKPEENLASALAALVPSSAFTKRGGKGFFELYQLARKKGYRRIAIVSSGRLDFIVVEPGDWSWEENYFDDVRLVKAPRLRNVDALRFEGINAGVVAGLFDEEDDKDAEVAVECGEKKMSVTSSGKVVFGLECVLKTRKPVV